MEKNGFRSKIRKIISFCFSTCITFSTLTSRKKAKLLSSKTMFPQCPYTPLIQSIYHTLLSSMSMLGVLCHPWWWSAWQIVPNELCLKKKKEWNQSLQESHMLSSAPYMDQHMLCWIWIHNSSSFLPTTGIVLGPKPIFFGHFTPKVLQPFPYIIPFSNIHSLEKPAQV